LLLIVSELSLQFVCPTEILSFSDAQSAEFDKIDTQVLAISTDSQHTHLAWIRTKQVDGGLGKVNIPLIADTSKQISKSYGVLVEDENDEMYGTSSQRQPEHRESIPCERLFLVDEVAVAFQRHDRWIK
jgi:alkyl hydroperoxide reductase subunit AhpC